MFTRQCGTSARPKTDAAGAQQRPIVETAPPTAASLGRVRHLGPGAVVPHPRSQATALTEAGGGRLVRAGHALLQLQRRYGNRYVQQVVGHARRAADPASEPVIQTELVVGPSGDRYERAADRVAQQVADHPVQRQAGDPSGECPVPRIRPIRGTAGRTMDASVQQAIEGTCGGRSLPHGRVIQRLIAVPDDKLFVPPAWLDDREDPGSQNIREVRAKGNSDPELQALLATIHVLVPDLDEWITEIIETDVAGLLSTLHKAQVLTYVRPADDAERAIFQRTLRSLVTRDLNELRSVTILEGKPNISAQNVEQVWRGLRRNPVPMPGSLIPHVPDLERDLDELHVCTLISLVMANPRRAAEIVEQWSRADAAAHDATQAKAKEDEDVYIRTSALHWYYFVDKGLLYDDASTHPGLFAEWDYRLIFSGQSSFRDLAANLPPGVTLERGKGYIFDVTGHAVYVTMLRKVEHGVDIGAGAERSYFKFHDQKWNWTKNEINETEIFCIYGQR